MNPPFNPEESAASIENKRRLIRWAKSRPSPTDTGKKASNYLTLAYTLQRHGWHSENKKWFKLRHALEGLDIIPAIIIEISSQLRNDIDNHLGKTTGGKYKNGTFRAIY